MGPTEPRPIRWTKDEYFRLSEEGYFNDRRVELIGGEIIEMAAQYNPHSTGVWLVQVALQAAFGPNYFPRGQATLDLSPHGCPDPDVALVAGTPRSYVGQPVPTTALLVVEVADSSLNYDRNTKGSLYAAGGITDYWIVNIPDHQLEVYRQPIADASEPFGSRYANVAILKAGDFVSPLAAPAAQIPVADLIP
jgi:Uma2 family endonuclease